MSLLPFMLGAVTTGRITLPAAINIAYDDTSPGNITAALTAQVDGNLTATDPGGATDFADWFYPNGLNRGAFYEIYLATGSGTVSSGTVDAWLPLSSARTWNVNVTTANPAGNVRKTFTGTLSIRHVGGAVIASCPVTLDAWLHP